MSNGNPDHPSHIPPPRGLDRRRIFIISFTFLCIAFVPVFLFLGLYLSLCPVSGLIANFGTKFNRVSIAVLIHILIYIAMFIGAGVVIHGSAMRVRWQSLRHGILILFLAIPISCSFARVLTYGSIQGGGGTYTFWEAVDRYFEKKEIQARKAER